MSLFDAPTGGEAVNLKSGSPAYQDAIYNNVQRQLKPAYQNALKGTQQSFSSRGLLDSGLEAQGELGTQQHYLDQLAGTATDAAVHGADETENNRRFEEGRQDRASALQFQKDEANREQGNREHDQWSSLVGAGATAVGGLAGGALYGLLSKPAAAPAAKKAYTGAYGPYNQADPNAPSY